MKNEKNNLKSDGIYIDRNTSGLYGDYELKFEEAEKPAAYLEHIPTKTIIPVYKKIGPFRRYMLWLCFGLKYEKTL